jgi:hypothetical protein
VVIALLRIVLKWSLSNAEPAGSLLILLPLPLNQIVKQGLQLPKVLASRRVDDDRPVLPSGPTSFSNISSWAMSGCVAAMINRTERKGHVRILSFRRPIGDRSCL